MTAAVIPFPRTPDERLARAAAPFADDLAEKMAARKERRACLHIVGRKATACFGEAHIRTKLERLGRYVRDGRNPGRSKAVLVITRDRCAWLPLRELVRAAEVWA